MIYKLQRLNLENMNLIKNGFIHMEIKESLEIGDYGLFLEKNNGSTIYIYKVVDKIAFAEIEQRDLYNDFKKFVMKIDLIEYNEKLKKERKLEEIQRILEEKAKNIEKYVTFENLAKYDESAKKLFEEYKNLLGGTDNLLNDITKGENNE